MCHEPHGAPDPTQIGPVALDIGPAARGDDRADRTADSIDRLPMSNQFEARIARGQQTKNCVPATQIAAIADASFANRVGLGALMKTPPGERAAP